ncbi:MAG TPA: DUF1801 domain-containing protein [Candidatus Competibacter sp.]|nr:DUF1801 domain-containing protein [Candidatus Competibacter sp.]
MNNLPSPDVNSFMEQLDHPFKADIERLRTAIMGIAPIITEEIKWNAPSFKINDHFATFKLYPTKNIQIVLHTGAKPKIPQKAFSLDDPHKLLKWPAIDRCVLTLQSSSQAVELEQVVIKMVKEWIQQL